MEMQDIEYCASGASYCAQQTGVSDQAMLLDSRHEELLRIEDAFPLHHNINLPGFEVCKMFGLAQPDASAAAAWNKAIKPRSAGGGGTCEDMAFCGDALLKEGVAQELQRRYPGASRSFLHDQCQRYITNDVLAKVGDKLQFSNFIFPANCLPLSRREKATVVEALIAGCEQANGTQAALRTVSNLMNYINAL